MGNPAKNERVLASFEKLATQAEGCEIVQLMSESCARESMSEYSNDELEAWARHALASNGFGDF